MPNDVEMIEQLARALGEQDGIRWWKEGVDLVAADFYRKRANILYSSIRAAQEVGLIPRQTPDLITGESD